MQIQEPVNAPGQAAGHREVGRMAHTTEEHSIIGVLD